MLCRCGRTFLAKSPVPQSMIRSLSIKFGSESPTFVANSHRRTEESVWHQWPQVHNPALPKTPTKFSLTSPLIPSLGPPRPITREVQRLTNPLGIVQVEVCDFHI